MRLLSLCRTAQPRTACFGAGVAVIGIRSRTGCSRLPDRPPCLSRRQAIVLVAPCRPARGPRSGAGRRPIGPMQARRSCRPSSNTISIGTRRTPRKPMPNTSRPHSGWPPTGSPSTPGARKFAPGAGYSTSAARKAAAPSSSWISTSTLSDSICRRT